MFVFIISFQFMDSFLKVILYFFLSRSEIKPKLCYRCTTLWLRKRAIAWRFECVSAKSSLFFLLWIFCLEVFDSFNGGGMNWFVVCWRVVVLVEAGCDECLNRILDWPNIWVGIFGGWKVMVWVWASSHWICFRLFRDNWEGGFLMRRWVLDRALWLCESQIYCLWGFWGF